MLESFRRSEGVPHHVSFAKSIVLGEELYLYLAITPHAVSSTLIREEDKVQRPVYNTSKALRGVEG